MKTASWLDPILTSALTEGEPDEEIVTIPARRLSENEQKEWDENYIPFPRDEE